MILRDRCSTWYDLASIFVAGAMDKSQNASARGHQLCTQLSIFEGCLPKLLCFLFVNFENLGSSKIEEILQNCYVFDVVRVQACR